MLETLRSVVIISKTPASTSKRDIERVNKILPLLDPSRVRLLGAHFSLSQLVQSPLRRTQRPILHHRQRGTPEIRHCPVSTRYVSRYSPCVWFERALRVASTMGYHQRRPRLKNTARCHTGFEAFNRSDEEPLQLSYSGTASNAALCASCSIGPSIQHVCWTSCELRVRAQNRPRTLSCNRNDERVTFYIMIT